MALLKKFKLVFILAAAVLIGVLCLVACGKGGTDKNDTEQQEKPKPEVVVGISVDTTNADLVYELGGKPFDVAGVALVKQLDDGTEKRALVTRDMVFFEPDMTTRGQKLVVISYRDFTAEYSITVRELQSFGVDASSAKTSFEVGEAFSDEGLVVTANFYESDTTETLNSGYEVIAPDMTTPGIKTVRVSYCGVEKTYNIAVRKAPTLLSATLLSTNSIVDIKITGELDGYAEADFAFDLQKLMSDEYIKDFTSVSANYTQATGSFALTVQINLLNLEKMTDVNDVGYMLHVKINGISYDIVDLAEEVVSVTSANGTYYRLKSEKCFSDNESKFVILRAAASQELLSPKELSVQTVTLEERDGKLGLAVNGNVAGLTLDGLVIQLREKENWDNTIALDTTVEITGETFTAFAEIPDGDSRIHVGKVLFTRMLVPGYIEESDPSADKELHDLPTPVTTTEVSFGTGKYTLKQESLYDAKQLVTILYESEEVEYSITEVKLEVKDGRLCYVIGGTFEGSAANWFPALDMQRTYGVWDIVAMPTAASAEFGDGTFTITQDITEFAFDVDQDNPYITHLIVRGHSGDVCDVGGFEDMSVRFEKNGVTYSYSIYAAQRFAPDNLSYYICIKVTTAE